MAAPAGSRMVALFKRGWNEIPEVVGSTVVALIGGVIGSYGLWNYYRLDGDNRRFKTAIVIYRPDDTRISKIRYD